MYDVVRIIGAQRKSTHFHSLLLVLDILVREEFLCESVMKSFSGGNRPRFVDVFWQDSLRNYDLDLCFVAYVVFDLASNVRLALFSQI